MVKTELTDEALGNAARLVRESMLFFTEGRGNTRSRIF